MPVPNYSVLTGTLKDKLDSNAAMQKYPHGSPHYQLLISAAGIDYRVAVNVKSDETPVNLEFFLDDNYQHTITEKLLSFKPGIHALKPNKDSGALDFVRMKLFDMTKMRPLPASSDPISGNDLNDIFTVHLNQAQNTPGALIYAFGSEWPADNKADDYFGNKPDAGVHDIHVNQGDKLDKNANGIYQDGALFIYYPDEPRWVAMFLRFQSQSTNTDDQGNPK